RWRQAGESLAPEVRDRVHLTGRVEDHAHIARLGAGRVEEGTKWALTVRGRRPPRLRQLHAAHRRSAFDLQIDELQARHLRELRQQVRLGSGRPRRVNWLGRELALALLGPRRKLALPIAEQVLQWRRRGFARQWSSLHARDRYHSILGDRRRLWQRRVRCGLGIRQASSRDRLYRHCAAIDAGRFPAWPEVPDERDSEHDRRAADCWSRQSHGRVTSISARLSDELLRRLAFPRGTQQRLDVALLRLVEMHAQVAALAP